MTDDDDVLTDLDAAILRRLGEGDTATALSGELGLPVETIIERAGAIRVRLGVTSTAAAAVTARELGLL